LCLFCVCGCLVLFVNSVVIQRCLRVYSLLPGLFGWFFACLAFVGYCWCFVDCLFIVYCACVLLIYVFIVLIVLLGSFISVFIWYVWLLVLVRYSGWLFIGVGCRCCLGDCWCLILCIVVFVLLDCSRFIWLCVWLVLFFVGCLLLF